MLYYILYYISVDSILFPDDEASRCHHEDYRLSFKRNYYTFYIISCYPSKMPIEKKGYPRSLWDPLTIILEFPEVPKSWEPSEYSI